MKPNTLASKAKQPGAAGNLQAGLNVTLSVGGQQSRPAKAARPSRTNYDLGWLVRYANHGGFEGSSAKGFEHDLRRAFGAGAWRLVCRSPKACFLPILSNRQLTLASLITYCKRLVEHSFEQAPRAILLDYFVNQRRMFFNLPCRVPEDTDYTLMRIANGAPVLRLPDIALVANWASEGNEHSLRNQKWESLVRRVVRERQKNSAEVLAKQQVQWHFYCREVDWRGHRLEPLTNAAALWVEGLAMGHCAYQLRGECDGPKLSRFFSVRKLGKRLATLELVWKPPAHGFTGMDREWGQWSLQDVRLSCNRLPSDVLAKEMREFAAMFNAWSKRPARHAPDELQRVYGQLPKPRLRRLGVWRPAFGRSLVPTT